MVIWDYICIISSSILVNIKIISIVGVQWLNQPKWGVNSKSLSFFVVVKIYSEK
jgi:hypothetical protein